MTTASNKATYQEVEALLYEFFPDEAIRDADYIQNQIESGEILTQKQQILPYLQTVYFEEHLIELQLGQTTRVFFSRVLDDDIKGLPNNTDDTILAEYEEGSYLKEGDDVVVNPLSPRIGNAQIRTADKLIVRFFIGTKAVELGCSFCRQDMHNEEPVIRLNFPTIGRINRNYRPYRVKVVTAMKIKVSILGPKSRIAQGQVYRLYDVCNTGMAIEMAKEKNDFEIGETIRFKIEGTGIQDVEIDGNIRHSSNVLSPGGSTNICGVQFDLLTRSLAAHIEQMAAAIQRLQLREMGERTADMRGVRLIK